MELHWDVAEFGTTRVKVAVFNPKTGAEQLVCAGAAAGQRKLPAWVRPGMEFRLLDELDDMRLGTLVIDDQASTQEA